MPAAIRSFAYASFCLLAFTDPAEASIFTPAAKPSAAELANTVLADKLPSVGVGVCPEYMHRAGGAFLPLLNLLLPYGVPAEVPGRPPLYKPLEPRAHQEYRGLVECGQRKE